MSVAAIQWAMDPPKAYGTELLVLIVIAERADRETWEACPGPESIARRANVCNFGELEKPRPDADPEAVKAYRRKRESAIRSTKRSLEHLEERGLLEARGVHPRYGTRIRRVAPDHMSADANAPLVRRDSSDTVSGDPDHTSGNTDERSANPDTMSPKPLPNLAVNRDCPNPKGQDDRNLVGKVCSILQGGIDALPENDFGRPWPAAKSAEVARAIQAAKAPEDIVLRAAREAREIVQSEDRAPNISSLFAKKLQDLAERAADVREAIEDSLASAKPRVMPRRRVTNEDLSACDRGTVRSGFDPTELAHQQGIELCPEVPA